MAFFGTGTERVEQEVSEHFPQARLLRMDRDTVTTKGAHARILAQFARGDADILMGTQMIAKGHDFPEVTLVGVINADVGLYRPDFRAAERTFQLIAQVAGRAGRGPKGGRVLVQTRQPEHPALGFAAQRHFGGHGNRCGRVVHLGVDGAGQRQEGRAGGKKGACVHGAGSLGLLCSENSHD